MTTKRKKKVIMSDNAKKIVAASVMAAAAVSIGAVTGEINEADAAVQYYWEKYEVNSEKQNALETFNENMPAAMTGIIYGRTSFSFDPSSGFIPSGEEGYVHYGRYGTIYVGSGHEMTRYDNAPVVGLTTTSYRIKETVVSQSKGKLITSVIADESAYTNNAVNSDGYWYVRGAAVPTNTAPTTPTLTVPTTQFEHGDKHIIGFGSTDAEGNPITYTLEAKYDNESNWTSLYTGTARSYEYQVPSNKGKVQFRVKASDGSLTSAYATSAEKSIREVMYYWNKFAAVNNTTSTIVPYTNAYFIIYEETEPTITISESILVNDEQKIGGYYNYVRQVASLDPNFLLNRFTISSDGLSAVKYESVETDYINANGHRVIQYRGILYNLKTEISPGYKKGSLIQNNLTAGFNAYPNDARNSDGFWYVRGQRVLSEDVTPPIIELTEQSNYDTTSKITVKTHDLGKVSKVKWAQGERAASYFISNGTEITGTQTAEGGNFTVSENGTYTVYAVDNKGNAAVQTIEVKNVNLPPEIQVVSGHNKYDVVDNEKTVSIQGAYIDRENDDVTTTAKYNGTSVGTGSGSNGSFTVDVNTNSLANGVHDNPYEIIANDGYADSPAVRSTNHIVIKVDDAADYNRLLSLHSEEADTFTLVQHQAFYDAYTAVLAYEARTGTKADADSKVGALQEQTGITDSAALTEMESRLLLMEAVLSAENAEKTLIKADFEATKELLTVLEERFETLDEPAPSAGMLQDVQVRVAELERYHSASDAITLLEKEVDKPVGQRDPSILSWTTINEASALVNAVENTTNKAALRTKLNKVIVKFVNSKETITIEDLEELVGEEADIQLEAIYDEYKDEFKDLTVHMGALVKFVNALKTALSSMREAEVTAFNTMFSNMAAELQTRPNLLAVQDAVNELYAARTGMITNETIQTAINGKMSAVPFARTNELMKLVSSALKEVYEYNTVDFNETHSELEKGEGQAAVTQLGESVLANGHLQVDMQAFLDNGIPDIHLTDGMHAYITDGTLTITGTVRDENHSTHSVEVSYNGETKTVSTSGDGTFEVAFTLTEPGYLTHELFVTANDGLTEKKVSYTELPVFHVTDVALFTRFAQALETDRAITFDQITPAFATELYSLYETVQSHTLFDLQSERELLNRAETLSNKQDGALKGLIQELLADEYFKWLIDHYSTATVEDFHTVGIEGVTEDNIAALKTIMDDYVAEFTKEPTPLLAQYEEWLGLLQQMNEIHEKIAEAGAITESQAVKAQIEEIEAAVTALPDWLSGKASLVDELQVLKDAEAAILSVENAEGSYQQTDVDTARTLVDALPASTIKDNLTERLDYLQTVVDAIVLVELAETSKAETDIANATAAVNGLSDEEPMKQQLQERLDAIAQLLEAEEAVAGAELSQTQADKDAAQALVDALPEGTVKDALQDRLDVLQGILDELLAGENAEEAIVKAEESWADGDIQDAQDFVNKLKDENPLKQELQDRLDNLNSLVSDYKNVVTLVENAEATAVDADADAAQSALDQLLANHSATGLVPDDRTTALQDRLNELDAYIEAEKLVSHAESSLDESDIKTAKDAVTALTDGPPKQSLQTRLDALDKLVEAVKAVETAEQSTSQVDVDKATDLVAALPDGPEKEELQNRLDQVQDAIDKKNAEDKAADAVNTAEETWTEEDVEHAKELVDALPDGAVKDELQDRLNDLETVVDHFGQAKEAVVKAEASLLEVDADAAQELINLLPDNTNKSALQDRLDAVYQYLEAEKAVVRAEKLQTQGTKDAAQVLVDKLPDSEAKQALQERLDALQSVIDEKAENLLDKLIDDPHAVTPEELADYTNETVYEELMDDYIDKIIEQGDGLTKEQVVQIVRLINAYEWAKLTMEPSYISSYQKEYVAAQTVISVSEYPTPTFISTVEQYKGTESVLAQLISLVAAETGMSEADVQLELEKIRATDEAQTGTFIVEYRLEDGTVIQSQEQTAEYGEITVTGALEGYDIIGEGTKVFTLDKTTEGHIISFVVSEKQQETGSYTLRYVTETGELVKETTVTDVPYGEIIFTHALEGYTVTNGENSFVLSEETNEQVFEFVVAANEATEEEQPEESQIVGSYTVEYRLQDETVVASNVVEVTEYGVFDIDHSGIEGNFEYVEEQELPLTVTITEDTPNTTVVFYVKEVPASGEQAGEQPEENTPEQGQEEVTEQPETELPEEGLSEEVQEEVQSENVDGTSNAASAPSPETVPTAKTGIMTVASIDNLVFSFSSSLANAETTRADYLAKAFYALEGVKTAKSVADNAEYVEQVKIYIVNNLEDGPYKEYLLAELGFIITDIGNGDDGKPDLTPVSPYKPPVVEPTPPPVVEKPTPPVVVDPTPPVVKPTPPVDKEDQDVAGDADEKENTVTHEVKDNEQHWKLENPTGDSYTFKGDGISITIPLDADVDLVEVRWIHLGKQHYQLEVKFDGKRVHSFKKNVEISKDHDFAYLVRGTGGQYEAMPYKYKGGIFKFGTKNIELPFYFSTTKRTFQDINGLYSKDAVEELASRYVIQGTTKTTYSPYANITRSQFSVMIARALALEPTTTPTFKDTQRHWAKDEIQALVELGVVKGINASRFEPAGNLTRQQAALMIYRLLKSQGVALPKAGPDFLDNDKLKGEVAEAAGALQALGIFEGTKGYFNPSDKLTRAQMAKVLQLSLELTNSY